MQDGGRLRRHRFSLSAKVWRTIHREVRSGSLYQQTRKLSYFENIFVLRRLSERSFRNLARYLEELPGVRVAFSGQHDGQATVASVADFRVQFNRTQERQITLLGQALRATPGKDVNDLITVRAGELAHVFHQAQHFDIDLMEHLQGFTRVLERNI